MFFGKSMSRTRCTGGLVDALQQHGLEVRWRNMATLRRWLGRDLAQKWVRREFYSYRPDLVFVFFRDLPGQLLAEFRQHARVVLWVEEALEDVDHAVVEYFQHADLVCMSNPARIPWLREQGLDNQLFLMSGFSPRYHHPASVRKPLRDVAFIGGPGRKGQRAAFLARISDRFKTEVFGLHWDRWRPHHPNLQIRGPVRPRAYARVCATSRIVLGVNEINDDLCYFSNRTWLTLACGGFHLTHYVPGLERVFQPGEHLDWFEDEDQALERIEHYLPRDHERARIASCGHNYVRAHHSYFHRVSRMLQALRDGLPESLEPEFVLRPQAPSTAGESGVLAPGRARE